MLKFIGAEFVGGRKLSVREQKMYRKNLIQMLLGFLWVSLALCFRYLFGRNVIMNYPMNVDGEFQQNSK